MIINVSKSKLIILVLLGFALFVSCKKNEENNIDKKEMTFNSYDNEMQLIVEKSKSMLFNEKLKCKSEEEVIVDFIFVENNKLPVLRLASNLQKAYPVIVENSEPVALLEVDQEIIGNEATYKHFFSDGTYFGFYTLNQDGDLLETYIDPIVFEILAQKAQYGSIRECAAAHYVQMMEIISNDAELDLLCSGMGFLCNLSVYAGAVGHCELRHSIQTN